MQYDENIDQAIVSVLGECHPLGFLKLKEAIDNLLDRTLSFETYNRHLKQMTKRNIIRKQDNKKRGKPVFYSLTEDTKRQYQLKLFGLNPQRTLFKKIYEKIFFYEIFHTPLYILGSEEKLDAFLVETNTSRSDLENDKHLPFSLDMRYAKEQEKLTYATVDTKYTLKSGVIIIKTRYWEANKYTENNYATEYTFTLPGVSINEFMYNDDLVNTKFRRDDIEEGFSILIKSNLIKPVLVFRGESRFIIAEERLQSFIRDLRWVYHKESSYLLHKWQHFSEPTKEEYQRMSFLLNDEEVSAMFKTAEKSRLFDDEVRGGEIRFLPAGKYKKPIDYFREVRQEQDKLKSEFIKEVRTVRKKHHQTIKDFVFLHEIIGIVCPLILH